MIKMVIYRFQVFITPQTLEYLMKAILNIQDDDNREEVLKRWVDFLSMGEDIVGGYRDVFYNFIMGVFSSLYKDYKDSENPIWKLFSFFARKYYMENKTREIETLKENQFGKAKTKF